MRELIGELRALQAKQESVWGTVKDVADTAVSSIPVAGDVYNGAIGAYKAGKAAYHASKGVAQWATGNKKGATSSFKKAKSAGVDALGRGAMAAASSVGAGGAAKIAGRSILKPLVKTALSAGVKTAAKAAIDANHTTPSIPPKKKKSAGTSAASGAIPPSPPKPIEGVSFPSVLALVEFRVMAGMSITKKHQQQLEAEEAGSDAVR